MPTSAFTPDVVVELGLGYGYSAPIASIAWVDVSDYVEAQQTITITRGRSDEFGDPSPSQLTLTLDNRDGRFTPDNASSPYFGQIKIGVPIRVSAKWPLGGGTTYRRFTGYVSEWPVEWPQGTSGSAHATVRAASRSARLGRNSLSYALAEQLLPDGPVMWYPLSEPKDSTKAFNHAATAQNPLAIQGSDATVTFGEDGGAPFDDRTAVTITAPSPPLGKWLEAPVLNQPSSGQVALAFECWVTTTTTPQTLMVLSDTTGFVSLGVNVGVVQLVIDPSSGSTAAEFFGPTEIIDGEPHHVVAKYVLNGAGSVTLTVILDGEHIADVASAVGWNAFPAFDTFTVGVDTTAGIGNPIDATIGQVAVYGGATVPSTAVFQDHYAAGLDGFEGDAADARINRIVEWAEIPAADVSLEAPSTVSMSGAEIEGQSVIEAMLDVAHTENGLLFDGGDGKLYFHGRQHRYNATAAVTLSAATQQVESDLLPKMDDQSLVNQQTAALPSGYTATAEDAASIDAYGVYGASITILSIVEDEADQAAQYRVNVYAEPLIRLPQCSVQLITQDSTTVANLLGTELGDLVTLTGLPSQAPASSMDFFVEGYTEVIGSEGQGWLWTANLSPGDIPGDGWTLGTSQLGTATVLAY